MKDKIEVEYAGWKISYSETRNEWVPTDPKGDERRECETLASAKEAVDRYIKNAEKEKKTPFPRVKMVSDQGNQLEEYEVTSLSVERYSIQAWVIPIKIGRDGNLYNGNRQKTSISYGKRIILTSDNLTELSKVREIEKKIAALESEKFKLVHEWPEAIHFFKTRGDLPADAKP